MTSIVVPNQNADEIPLVLLSSDKGGRYLPMSFPAATQDVADLGSLIYGDVADKGWSQITPAAAAQTRPDGSSSVQGDGMQDAVFCNYTGAAPGVGSLERQIFIPPGVTQIRMQAIMRLPVGVNSGTVRVQIGDAPFTTDLGHIDVALTSSYVAYQTPIVNVVAGSIYTARLLFNSPGSQAQALVARVSVVPVTSSNTFWLQSFTRIDAQPRIHFDNGYSNQRLQTSSFATALYHWFVSPHSSVEFTTTAGQIFLEQLNDLAAVPSDCQFAIFINGRLNQVVSPSVNTWTFMPVTLPSGLKRVRIVQGGYTGPTPLASVAICQFTAIYVESGAYVAVIPPTREPSTMVFYGDSKLTGQLSSNIQAAGFPGLLRRKYPGRIAMESWGGRALADESASTVTAQAQVIANYKPTIAAIGIGRNDWQGNKWATAAAFGTRLGQLVDQVHSNCPAAQVMLLGPSSEANESANGNGWTLADVRTQMSTIQSTRTTFCTYTDLSTLWTTGQTNTYTYDGVHPNDIGLGLVADAILAATP